MEKKIVNIGRKFKMLANRKSTHHKIVCTKGKGVDFDLAI